MAPFAQKLIRTKAFLYGEVALVMVYDDRDTAVWTQLGEPLLLLDILANVDALPCVVLAVCFLQLLEQDGGLPAVWCTPCEQLNALVCLEAGGSFVSHLGEYLQRSSGRGVELSSQWAFGCL